MAKWEIVEAVLDDAGYRSGDTITAAELAAILDVHRETASDLIQAHQEKQRSPNPPRHQLTRSGRTRSAVWTVGARAPERELLKETVKGDIATRISRALVPDLDALAVHNPKQAQDCQRIVRACTRVCVELLGEVLG